MNKRAMKNSIAIRSIAAKDFLRSGLVATRGHSVDSFAHFAGGLLFFIGVAEILGALNQSQVLGLADPIFGISFRHLMLMTGIVQLAIALVLLFTNWRILGLGLAAWISANFLAFRIGLWSMGWHHSSGFMVHPLGLSMTATDVIFSLSSVFLLVGSVAILWHERWTAQAANFLKMPCPSCGGHIRFAIQNLGQIISCPHCQKETTLRKLDLLKMTCFFCKEHIEFPVHALGQKISCPHCNRGITLMEPA